jgi:HD superfamily phosphohydrolase YqeK
MLSPPMPRTRHVEPPTTTGHKTPLHPLVLEAADGRLPDWAEAGPERREHIARVAELLDAWADEAELPEEDRQRWRAAGYLHDAVRDAAPESLRPLVSGDLAGLPGSLLHGPAVATRLRREGVEDDELLGAIAYHTLGDPGLGPLGRALYAADFLEPGRTYRVEGREDLCARAPSELDAVTREVARLRIAHLLRKGLALHERTVAFWNALVEERA